MAPASAPQEAALWYQYYFHSERGRRGLEKNRREIARLLWRMWSPNWAFDDATFDRTASALDNPDFVAVVIHSYRHRYGLAPAAGDPRYDEIEMGLAAQPPIAVPAITIDGDADGVNSGTAHHAKKFTGPHEHRIFKGSGHNLPQERPEEWAQAVIDARKMANAEGNEGGHQPLLKWKGTRDWRSQTFQSSVGTSGLTAEACRHFRSGPYNRRFG